MNNGSIDNGVIFVLDNFEKAIRVCKNNPQHKNLLRRLQVEYSRIKHIKYMGNMLDYLKKFSDELKYTDDFELYSKYGLLTSKEMANYLIENYSNEIENRLKIQDLTIGTILTNGEIISLFRVKSQGYVRKSNTLNHFVLISDKKLGLNKINEEKGTIDFALLNNNLKLSENEGLINSIQTKTKIYLFERIKKDNFRYFGELKVNGDIYINDDTKKIILPLIRINSNNIYLSEHKIAYFTGVQSKKAATFGKPDESELIRKKMHSTDRDRYVSAYVKHRANGHCDLCSHKAPFIDKDGNFFLECHHVIHIANNGPDRVYNAVALCPNCHRKIHYLRRAQDQEKLIEKLRNYLKEDKDNPDNLKYFNELFGLSDD